MIKKSLKILVILLASFTLCVNADAAATCEGVKYPCVLTSTKGAIIYGTKAIANWNATHIRKHHPGGYYNYTALSFYSLRLNHTGVNPAYYYQYEQSTGKALYCLDADQTGLVDLYADRILMKNSNSGGELSTQNYATDIGMMSILVNGAQTWEGSKWYYGSTSIALRAYLYVFGWDRSLDKYLSQAYFGQAYYWILENQKLIDAYYIIKTHDPNVKNNQWQLIKWNDARARFTAYGDGGIVLDNAKTLFTNALLEVAAYYQSLDDTVATVEQTATTPDAASTETPVGEDVLVSKNVVHTLTLKNFKKDKNPSFKIDSVTFTKNIAELGVKSPQVKSVKINGVEVSGNLIGTNLLENIEVTDSMTVDITLYFEGLESEINCEEPLMDYTVNYSWSTDDSSKKSSAYEEYVGIVWRPYSTSTSLQRFVSIEPAVKASSSDASSANTETAKISNKVSLVEKCETNCDLLREACVKTNNRNSKECQDYIKEDCDSCDDLKTMCDMNMTNPVVTKPCDDYNAVCDIKCEVSYTQFECCDKEGDLLISEVENFDKPNVNNKEVTIKGPENIKACFVTTIDKKCEDAEDADNNSCVDVGTEDEKENSYALAATNNNKYCTVSCKEDYVFLMPTAKLVNSGRYFTFKAQIQGTKTCYTNTIDREQYNKDIVAAQVRLVNAYNEWYRWDTAYNDTIKTYMSYSYTSCCSCSCSEPPCGTCCCCNAYGGCNRYYVQGSVESQDVNKTDEKTGTITLQDTVLTYSYYEDGGSSGGCGSTCRSGSTSTLLSNIKKNFLDPAAKELAAAQEAYQKIVTDFNTCGGWDSQINFKPDVYYDYEEDYLEANGLTGEMIETDKKAISNSYWYCNSQIDASGRENSKGQLSDNNYERCTSATSTAKDYNTTEITYIYCTEDDGCQEKTEKISTARYKKMISKTATTYKPKTLFYNIYPSGTITINSNEPNTTEVPNGLPINLNTKRGIYKYTVNITNIGEFYNIANTDDNLGRYAGGKNSLLGDKIVYACSYLVNMPVSSSDQLKCEFDKCDDCTVDCIGPNCDNVCDGGNCVADCVGMGCIYDNDAGSQLVERIVSLNNLFPNGTTSYNWSSTSNEKAKETISAIQTKGNKAYEEEPILSITMDPSTAKEIVKYNDDAESSGGYSNNTLHCYKLGNYERAACYSEFIDMIIDGEFGDKVINEKSKIQRSNDYRTGLDVSTSDAKTDDDYFRLWNGTIDPKRMLGPSWR